MTDRKQPNIIYIVADQWRGDCLGLYGNAHPVMTPHPQRQRSKRPPPQPHAPNTEPAPPHGRRVLGTSH